MLDFTKKPVLGMVHLYGRGRADRIARALADIDIYECCGVHGAIIENYASGATVHDVEAVLCALQDKCSSLEFGVNILPNEYASAFDLASRYPVSFVQLDAVAGSYGRWDEEQNLPDYARLRALRKNLTVLGGVWPKYYGKSANTLERDLRVGADHADAIVVTGEGTGQETPLHKIVKFRTTLDALFKRRVPLIVGAGVTVDTIAGIASPADGVIVGSAFKAPAYDGDVSAPVLYDCVAQFMDEWRFRTHEIEQAKRV